MPEKVSESVQIVYEVGSAHRRSTYVIYRGTGLQWNPVKHLSIYSVIHVLDTNFLQQIKELFQHRYDDLCNGSCVRGHTHWRTPVLKRSPGAKVNEY